MTQVLSHERLLELLDYNPWTGELTWRVAPRNNRTRAGALAGWEDRRNPKTPYRYIIIGRKRYLASRLAWFWMTGAWPERELDHRNCNSLDNRWKNLRLATHMQNVANQRKRTDNKSGFKGVHRHGERFRAQLRSNGIQRHLGLFNTAEEAHVAYKAAAIIANGEFARHD